MSGWFYKITFVFFFITILSTRAQTNLVPNPSFEVHDTCPDYGSQIRRTITWFDANTGTSDYFNVCSAGDAELKHLNNKNMTLFTSGVPRVTMLGSGGIVGLGIL